jgi:hypothetical protein
MADEDVTVTVNDEPIETPAAGTPANGAAAPVADAVSDDIAEVRRKLDESEAKNRQLEGERNAALQRASQVETGAIGDRLAMVQSALDTIDANVATLQAQMADAMAAGDFARHSELNVALAKQLAAQPDLLRGKAALEHQAKNPVATRAVELDDSQKIELYTKTMEPRAKAWIQAHPQYVLDQKLNDRLLARHYSAKDAGHKEGTDGYFRFIEDGLNLPAGNGHAVVDPASQARTDDTGSEQPLSAAAAPTQRRDMQQPSPAAPSRGGGGSRTVRLTPAQQEAARISGQSYQEYAESMERERRAGNIGTKRVH